MKQTAVQWLIEEYFGGMENCTPDFRYHIEQAKALEEQRQLDLIRFMRTSDKMGKSIEDLHEQFKSE